MEKKKAVKSGGSSKEMESYAKKRAAKPTAEKASNPTLGSPAADRDWQARNDCDTLARAEEVKRDGARHAAAKAEARKRRNELARVAGVRGSSEA